MAFDLEKIGAALWKTAKEILAKTAYSEAAKQPGVQYEFEKAKVKAGKEVLWASFPVILLGAILAFIVIKKL
ncbi:hypothetical protein ES702_01756 [subsurface metagenome]